MFREDILSGLKSAVSKGETLKQAMMSFYNAGYKKEEIEEAAKSIQNPNLVPQPPIVQTVENQIKAPSQQIQSTSKVAPQSIQQQLQQIQNQISTQRVSNYGKKPKKLGSTITIFLVIILFLLLGSLIAIFLLRDQLTALLNRAF